MLAFSIRNLLDYPWCTYLTFGKLVAVIFFFFCFVAGQDIGAVKWQKDVKYFFQCTDSDSQQKPIQVPDIIFTTIK